MPEIICPNCRIAVSIDTDDTCPSCGWQPPQELVNRLHPERMRTFWRPQIPITTGTELPGNQASEIIGPVFAMTVRSRDFVSQMGAKLRSVVGGELKAMTEALEQSRVQTLVRLEERAVALGADAVIGMRFDVSQMEGLWTEVCAYGTAVRVVPSDVPSQSAEARAR